MLRSSSPHTLDGVLWAKAASLAALRQYYALPKKGKPQGCESTVLAAFLLSFPQNPLNPTVLSLATGTKCLGAARLARRALLRLIYAEIGTDNPPSWLVASGTDGRWRLKDGHQLHLYITQLPCGVMPVPPSPLEVRREQLDTMANGYSDVGFVQRKPGRGDTTLLVSCFDKITRWCAVGIQGALLSHILEPLYLSTITIGQLPGGAPDGFCIESNVVKVLCARLSCLSRKFPDPFKTNKPLFFEAPIPPKEFQQTSGDIPPLTCG
ncbi:tRNA-specific adenosine deaminase TAD1-like [Triticum dicoccoides]|uniref:tRNA-specific adenosine deaminase TAD1-like n=1 Tax=Triticum dicoccoides TaxID=85692 RepID=UPI00188F79AB|nr:tRNA-specific adenosine deaminase TAD1-like [Triticum dicoccoides]